jgi:GNAT superfamily N-acetyltransferase
MNRTVTHAPAILRDLGDGLILRRSTPADADALAELDSRILSDEGPDHPDERVGAWVRDLLSGDHPTFNVDDFTIVEDARAGRIVSTLNLISQTWTYDGIPFGVGRPELVATLPEYRNRGLVRAQFQAIHEWSAARGHLAQAITGIPWFYRQFGYEMGLALSGGRIGYLLHIPKLQDGEAEPCRLRPANEADLPFIQDVYEHASKRNLIACARDERLWRYEVFGKHEKNANRLEMRIIDSADGEPIGYLAHATRLWRTMMPANFFELKPGASWLAVAPSVMRYLQATGELYASRDKKPFDSFAFWLGGDHPVYHAAADRLPVLRKPYAWYMRVPELSGFLRHIAPVLERRLASSELTGFTGEVKISFYRSGLRLGFQHGCLSVSESWRPTPAERGTAAFPDLTFLQLLFGYRSLEELRHAFADCWVDSDEIGALLQALFPKRHSDVWPVA